MTAPRFDYRSRIPVYLQLARELAADIESGRFGPGRPLPSKRWLKEHYRVSGGTVEKAMQVLRDDQRFEIETVKGKGLFATLRNLGRDFGGSGLLSFTLDPDMPPDPIGPVPEWPGADQVGPG